ncbi:RNA polymerase sigma factor [Aliiroseovarius sp. YM-037]|uniref:RNA polymerase sigma factor n=1 Tax=Aliiroseovarius sp. YM-037 TaxID=3341728 RepID=UPI003A80B951
MTTAINPVHAALNVVMTKDRGRLLAALIASVRDFQLAEDSLQDAVTSALDHWGRSGVPRNPAGWLMQVARRKAIDRIRRGRSFDAKSAEYAALLELDQRDAEDEAGHHIPDHRLRLIFTCCHPALDLKTRVALTLRTLGGLTTPEIARAFLDRESAMAQRLSRARHKIAKAGVPFQIPDADILPERLHSVLTVIYLIYNEGYAATAGAGQVRLDLCEEALFLARLMARLSPDEPEVHGLLALILFTHSRRNARQNADGAYVPLEEQDRKLWDHALIAEGHAVLDGTKGIARPGPFLIQAAISALHCDAPQAADTDWPQIVALYRRLVTLDASPVVKLNHAVALSNLNGPEAALPMLDQLAEEMAGYQPFHAAQADLFRRSKQPERAKTAYQKALSLTQVECERAFLQARCDSLPQ